MLTKVRCLSSQWNHHVMRDGNHASFTTREPPEPDWWFNIPLVLKRFFDLWNQYTTNASRRCKLRVLWVLTSRLPIRVFSNPRFYSLLFKPPFQSRAYVCRTMNFVCKKQSEQIFSCHLWIWNGIPYSRNAPSSSISANLFLLF